MVTAYQAPLLTMQSPAPYVGAQAPAPYTPAQTTGGLDISSLINAILPLMMLMMVFGMLKPMMAGMSGAFGK